MWETTLIQNVMLPDAYGGPEQAISMMNTNLDLDITQYVSVNFDSLIEVIDMLGGIEIEVDDQEYVHLNNYCVELKELRKRL